MKTKKNSNLQLEKNSTLYFVLGLTAILALIYTAFEWKMYYKTSTELGELYVLDDLREEAPITIHKLPPPPPPKIQTPPVIEVVPDEIDVEETVIQSTEVNTDTQIVDVDDVEVAEVDGPEEIPWILVEDAPIFPGCEGESDKKACFQEMMQKHIRKNFRYPEPAQEMGLQGRVNVVFTIHKDGNISDIKMRGPHKILEDEASRIIAKLPKMTPGKQRGKAVKVPFAIPITFKLQ
ncbi:energy transducer TonB [Flagellimonas allohymeniacidonis]|uniref:Energy transducer TonB n=1 Tax=Flagellimonas allohymeniacidonis TaxID=2517819 RepID=A0A4Q8Q9I5_9FLAO|nr:energy transducer TonB [Allomuricauda hymeniacidonis]TAI46935.1 energy transducer TonB [Allomuricauda hymeniacidonis]